MAGLHKQQGPVTDGSYERVAGIFEKLLFFYAYLRLTTNRRIFFTELPVHG